MAFNQSLTGLIEPDTDAWRTATPERRRAFYREAGRRATARLRKQLLRGIGRTGRLMPARKHPRADGADGPVMDPHNVDSRTVTLLDCRADGAGCTLYWHNGPPRPDQHEAWSKILGYHARGQVRGAPVRDVRLAKLGIFHLKREMGEWFSGQRSGFREAARVRAEPPAPKPKKPAKAPPKPTGRIDIENASGAYGATGESIRRRIAAGTTTGFRQLKKKRVPL